MGNNSTFIIKSQAIIPMCNKCDMKSCDFKDSDDALLNCPLLKKVCEDKDGYLEPSPWNYLETLAAHITNLQTNYFNKDKVLYDKCGEVANTILKLRHDLLAIHL